MREAADDGDQDRGEDAHDDREDQVVDVRSLVRRQARLDEARRPEPAPASEADEDDVAGGRRDEAGEQRGSERRAEAGSARLDHHHAADDRPAEERGDGRERARACEQGALALTETED